MLKEKICELFNENKFDELEKFASEQDINELATALSSIKKDLLCDILPKLPEKVSEIGRASCRERVLAGV